jgi:hypothetical protein
MSAIVMSVAHKYFIKMTKQKFRLEDVESIKGSFATVIDCALFNNNHCAGCNWIPNVIVMGILNVNVMIIVTAMLYICLKEENIPEITLEKVLLNVQRVHLLVKFFSNANFYNPSFSNYFMVARSYRHC